MAGVVGKAEAKDRVKLVSEAEAAVHSILWEKSQELNVEDELIVCDAGGSTTDITSYRVTMEELQEANLSGTNNIGRPPDRTSLLTRKKTLKDLFRRKPPSLKFEQSPRIEGRSKPAISLKEVKPSDCQPAGGLYVNNALVAHLESQFYGAGDQADYMQRCIGKAEESFELNCKREFQDGQGAPHEYVVEIGLNVPGFVDNTIILSGETVKAFFEEPVNRIIWSIEKQMRGTNPRYIFLVGGFGTCKYLRQRVERAFGWGNIQVLFLDDAHGKAASDGSVIWYISKGVTARVARISFGIKVREDFNPDSAEHRARPRIITAAGVMRVTGKWSMVAQRGRVFDEKSFNKRRYKMTYASPDPDLENFTTELYAWSNDAVSPPEWISDPEDNTIDGFEWVCDIRANLGGLRGGLTKCQGKRGDYWELEFDVCIEFGGVEVSAHLEWKENGTTRRGEATIVVT